jgi:hypothetical protein
MPGILVAEDFAQVPDCCIDFENEMRVNWLSANPLMVEAGS